MSAPDGKLAPATSKQQPALVVRDTAPPVSPQDSGSHDPAVFTPRPLKTEPSAQQPESQGPGSVVDVLASATAVSVMSSVTFHLFLWSLALVLLPLLGFDWIENLVVDQRPLQAALGEENFADDAALFEVIADPESDAPQSPTNLEQLAAQLQQSDSGWLQSSMDDAFRSLVDTNASDEDASGGGILLKIPESGLAVTKGSFTAFTIPAQPQPRQAYSIVIEIRLPSSDKVYRVSDLSGKVVGTDGYTQKLPWDSRTAGASGYPVEGGAIKRLDSKTVLDVVRNRVQIIIRVPGGAQLVRDVITVRSRKLKEEQELELVFGRKPEPTDSE